MSKHTRRLTALVLLIGIGCTPVAWAQAISLTQGSFVTELLPLELDTPVAQFYNYVDQRAHTGFERAGHSLLFFYRDPDTGALSLGVIHGPPALDVTNATGVALFTLSGLPQSSTLNVLDDPQDRYDFAPPVARLRWKWHTGRTDGIVIGALGNDFSFQLAPHFIQGITQWEALTQGPQGPVVVPLPSLDQAVTFATGAAAGRGARAAFSVHPRDALYTYTPITFDAQQSLAPDGQRVALYEWDFDGDGTFDAQTTKPVVSQVYQHPGSVRVTLRVTSSEGLSATVSQTLTLEDQRGVVGKRTISTPVVLPGSTFRVTLRFELQRNMAGLGVEEGWPASWTITGVNNDGAVLKAQRGQWVFPNVVKAGQQKTIVYDVTVPPAQQLDALPDLYRVEGSLTGSLPKFATSIQGEASVTVASCLPTAVALSHYNVAKSLLDLRLGENISAEQLHYAQTLWLTQGSLPADCNPSLTLASLQNVASYRALDLAVDRALPSGGVQRGVVVQRTILTTLPNRQLFPSQAGGNRFRVQLDVRALRDLSNVGLSELLPFGWHVVPVEAPDVVYNPREQQWFVAGALKAGQTRRLVYDVVLPPDEREQTYTLRGSARAADSTFSEPFEGDQRVDVLVCLPALLAAAHWDPLSDRIDLSLDNTIQPSQAEAAVQLWLDDRALPGTCDTPLDFDTLSLISRYAFSGVGVDKPLPGAS